MKAYFVVTKQLSRPEKTFVGTILTQQLTVNMNYLIQSINVHSTLNTYLNL